MTHNVSRRTLAKGAAWAAPAVVATTAIPAYAASCPSAANIEKAVDTAFNAVLNAMPTVNQNYKFWFLETSDRFNNGFSGASLGLSGGALAVNYTGSQADMITRPLRFEFGFRNVDTSAAVNNDSISGTTIQGTQIKSPYPPGGLNLISDPARAAWTNDRLRSGNVSSSFVKMFNDAGAQVGGLTPDHSQFIPRGDHWSLNAVISTDTGFFSNALASGNKQDLISLYPGDGLYSGGRIYIGYGFKIKGWEPPTLDEVVALIGDPAYTATCIAEAYNKRAILWNSNPAEYGKGLSNLTALGWSPNNGSGVGTAVPLNEWVWSDVIGNYNSSVSREVGGQGLATNMKSGGANQYANMADFLANSVYASSVAPQLEYRDGIY